MTIQSSPSSPASSPLTPGWDAVLLAGFGGPESSEDVMPFLRNVTRGRGIPEERLVEVSHHYQALGGSSPINDQNRALQAALQAELTRRGIDLPVLWGNRNWAPYMADVVEQAHTDGQTRLLGLATSAYSCYSSCRQYREDFGMALEKTNLIGKMRIDKIRHYYNARGFLEPVMDSLVEAVHQAIRSGLSAADVEVVFTTHSIPHSMADTSGPAGTYAPGTGGAYVAQHLAACSTVVAAAEHTLGTSLNWQLGYQSRSGPPSMPWLDPDVNDIISGLPAQGRAGVIVVPIGFVSDHVEVVWDLDNEAKETAGEHGLFFARVATPGTDPRFVSALADLVEQRLDPSLPAEVITDRPASPNICGVNCCRNARAVKPTTSARDSAADWEGTGIETERLEASGIGREW
ncbi:ferrochelatase [Nakamurella antarctica]|uniref:Coproporphyrin III ferrochelatase n=1 Tax=Nakamurella antarctica TaxID=1902245 RepID=A0A3G8ZM47_9ACTN|nr:ferrochelatase [Nakamurella antarctica]AZI58429.1 ferrochelatase [Nakamurella antarctica]